jgi:Flp pilus assembly pilin Flp
MQDGGKVWEGQRMKKYFVKEEGQGLVEYGLIISLIAIVSIVSLGGLAGGISAKYDVFANALDMEQLEDGSYVITKEDGFIFKSDNLAWGRLDGGDVGGEKDILIPNSMNGTTIKGIWQDLFKNKGLTQVVFDAGSGLVQIHARAFKDNELTSINLPDSLQKLDGLAFAGNDITQITIGSGVTVWDSAFSNDGAGFVDAYDTNGAGTYVYDENGGWVKQP